jgi:hypothetical protein
VPAALAVLGPPHPDVSTAAITSTTSATTQVNARDRYCACPARPQVAVIVAVTPGRFLDCRGILTVALIASSALPAAPLLEKLISL